MSQYSTPAYVLATLIKNAGHIQEHDSVDPIWPYFLSRQPDDPTQCVTLYNAAPRLDGRNMDGTRITHPGVQIRSRASKETHAYEILRVIGDYTDTILREDVTVESVAYRVQNTTLTSGILPLGSTEDKNHQFTLNLIMTLIRS